MKKFLPFFLVTLLAFYGCANPSVGRDSDTDDVGKKGASEVEVDEDAVEVDEEDTAEYDYDAYPGTTGGEFLDDAIPGTTGDVIDFDFEAPAGVTSLSPQSDGVISLVTYELPQISDPQPQYGQQVRQQREGRPAARQQREGRPERQQGERSGGRPAARQLTPEQTKMLEQFPAVAGLPRIFSNLADDLHNPDGLTVSDDQQTIFMCCPNFNGRENNEGPKLHGSFLVSFDLRGRATKLLEFPVLEETGQFGSMGLDFGPDGHLYVCDNQYFFHKDHKSRVVRVLMNGKTPTGKIEIVATGLKLANAIMWMDDKLIVSDTVFDLEGKWGSGGLWVFSKEEALKAGSGDNPAIALKPNGTDEHLAVIEEVENIGRGDNSGADGVTCTPDGTVYFGNFGDGAMYRVTFDANMKATCEKIHKAGEVFSCCDGIFYDKRTDKVYINDSEKNAIRAFKPVKAGEKPVFELIWQNGDTDGADGSLDQPCECVVIGRRMIICNFDWTFPGLLNSKFDKPYTMSQIILQ